MKFLRPLSYVLNVLLPGIAVCILTIKGVYAFEAHDGISSALTLAILFIAVIPSFVYWSLIFLYFSPRNKRESFRVLLPFFLSILLSLDGDFFEWWNEFLFQSAATFVGLSLCLICGLIYLFHKNIHFMSAFHDNHIDILVSVLALLALVFTTVLLALPLGYWHYVLQIIISFFVFFPQLRLLYEKHKL